MVCNNSGVHVRHGVQFCPACGAVLSKRPGKGASPSMAITGGSIVVDARMSSNNDGQAIDSASAAGFVSSKSSRADAGSKSVSMGFSGYTLMSFGFASLILLLLPWVSLDPTTASKLCVIGINVPSLLAVTSSPNMLEGYLSQIVSSSKVAGVAASATNVLGNFAFVYVLWTASVACLVFGCVQLILTKKERTFVLVGLALSVVCCATFASVFSMVLPSLADSLAHTMFSLSPLFLACACVSAAGLLVGLYLVRATSKDEQD